MDFLKRFISQIIPIISVGPLIGFAGRTLKSLLSCFLSRTKFFLLEMNEINEIVAALQPILTEVKKLFCSSEIQAIIIPTLETIKIYGSTFIDTMFGFRRLSHQLALIALLQSSISVGRYFSTSMFLFFHSFTKYGKLRKQIRSQMNDADSYTAWHSLAEELDRLTGNDLWRKDDHSSLFDSGVLKKRIDDIRNFIKEG